MLVDLCPARSDAWRGWKASGGDIRGDRLGCSPREAGITLIEPRRGTDASVGGFAGLVGPPGGRSECPAAQPPRGAHLTRSAVAPRALKIGLCAGGAKVRFGVVGNHKIRASSRPWAGGHDLMLKPRWCGLFLPVSSAYVKTPSDKLPSSAASAAS